MEPKLMYSFIGLKEDHARILAWELGYKFRVLMWIDDLGERWTPITRDINKQRINVHIAWDKVVHVKIG